MAERLSAETRKAALAELAGWKESAGREAIERTFTFKDFNEAFGFMMLPRLQNTQPTGTEGHPFYYDVAAPSARCLG